MKERSVKHNIIQIREELIERNDFDEAQETKVPRYKLVREIEKYAGEDPRTIENYIDAMKRLGMLEKRKWEEVDDYVYILE